MGAGIVSGVSGLSDLGVGTVGSVGLAPETGGCSLMVGGVEAGVGIAKVGVGGLLVRDAGQRLWHNNIDDPVLFKGAGKARGSSQPNVPNERGRYTTKEELARNKFGLTKQEFTDTIHDIKYEVEGNPDMIFDLKTGDVIDPRSGEVVGNLKQFQP